MTAAEIIPIACALISCGCALFVAVRAGRWRETDDARAVLARLTAAEKEIEVLKIRQNDVPSKADVATLRGEVHALAEKVGATGEAVRGVASGIDRIETFWMQNSRVPG